MPTDLTVEDDETLFDESATVEVPDEVLAEFNESLDADIEEWSRALLERFEALGNRAVDEILAARREHLAPILERLAELEQVNDPQTLRAEIQRLLAELPELARQLQRDDTLRQALESKMSDAVEQAIVEELNQQGTML